MLLERIAAFLRQPGFSKRGHIFVCVSAGNWAVIEYQKSQKSSAEAVVFTANVGVVSQRLARFFSSPMEPKKPPASSEWHWRQRLGFLLPQRQDIWWTLTPNTLAEVSREIEDALGVALPAVEGYLQDESLRDLWLSGSSPGLTEVQRLKNLAVLLKAVGPEDRLDPILDELRRVSKANAMFLEQRFRV